MRVRNNCGLSEKSRSVYKGNLLYRENFITGIDFVNLNVENLTFTEGDAFSFGEATATVHYADGKTKTVRLQDEYEKPTKTQG